MVINHSSCCVTRKMYEQGIGGSRRGVLGARPLWDPILLFSHTFLPKSAHIRGPCPPNGCMPPTGNPGSTTAGCTISINIKIINGDVSGQWNSVDSHQLFPLHMIYSADFQTLVKVSIQLKFYFFKVPFRNNVVFVIKCVSALTFWLATFLFQIYEIKIIVGELEDGN